MALDPCQAHHAPPTAPPSPNTPRAPALQPHGSLPLPALLGFSLSGGAKYAHAGAIGVEADLVQFARAALGGKLSPHLRSQPEPSAQSGPLLELVGSSFARVAHDADKDVLVQFYSPDCGHCKKLRPVYEQVAAKLESESDVVVAQMDASVNDVPGFEPEGFPTIVLYTKANKKGIEYDGSRDAHDLVQFVQDARTGKNFIGGLPEPLDGDDFEAKGLHVEL